MPPSSDLNTISGSRPRERRKASGTPVVPPVADQREMGDLPGPDRAGGPRQVGGRRCEEDVRVDEDGDALVGRVVVREHEREVELAPLEQGEQVVVVPGLDEPHLHAGPPLHVPAHRVGEEAHPGALERSDPQRARLALGERPQVGLGRAQRGRRPARVAEQPQPRLGGRHGLPPPGRSSNGRPAARSSAAICWLIADCE